MALLTVSCVLAVRSAYAENPVWTHPLDGYNWGVAFDGSNAVYAGGDNIAKYDIQGSVVWTLPAIGAQDVTTDRIGGVYAAGFYGPNYQWHTFISKFDANGNSLWTTQFAPAGTAIASGVSADHLGNVFITGRLDPGGMPAIGVRNAFVNRYDAAGNLAWTRTLGDPSEDDEGQDACVDGQGNVYVTGYTNGSMGGTNFGGRDAFLAKYDVTGTLVWSRQLGTASQDEAWRVSVDGIGNVFIAGDTYGDFGGSAGGRDMFLGKFDAQGNLLWTRQLGTSATDIGWGVAADGAGGAFLGGYTWGSLGAQNAGLEDVAIAKYDANGNLTWVTQFGSSGGDRLRDICANGQDIAYLTGAGFVAAVSIPEPATLSLLAAGLGAVWLKRRRR